MLNPSVLVDSVVAALQTIDELVSAMDGDPENIYAHHFLFGTTRLAEAIYQMTSPSILVTWSGTLGGNFDGCTLWKDRIDIYVRAQNVANSDQIGYEDLWEFIMNSPVNGTDPQYKLNIRNVELVPGQWTLCDIPSAAMRQDESGIDYMVISMSVPQLGDD